MKLTDPVKTIMTENVLSIADNESLMNVLRILRRNKFRHLPVTRGDEIVGILSRTDINRLTFGALFEDHGDSDAAVLELLTVPQVMSRKPVVVSMDTPIGEVAEVFATSEFHALPVVDGKELKGIVTTTDIIKNMLVAMQVG